VEKVKELNGKKVKEISRAEWQGIVFGVWTGIGQALDSVWIALLL
jgi:hypothetical protein